MTRVHPGLDGTADLDEAMTSLGARLELLPPVVDHRTIAHGAAIAAMEGNLFSWTWSLDDETRRRAAAAVRPWVETRFGPLDQPRDVEWAIRWRAYHLP